MTQLYDPELDSLTAILLACGYTHRKLTALPLGKSRNSREILNASGEVVFTGPYQDTLHWLHITAQAAPRSE